MKNKIPNAKEFIRTNATDYWEGGKAQYTSEDFERVMVNFAKLHVKAAIKSVLKPYSTKLSKNTEHTPDAIRHIKNAYPESKII